MRLKNVFYQSLILSIVLFSNAASNLIAEEAKDSQTKLEKADSSQKGKVEMSSPEKKEAAKQDKTDPKQLATAVFAGGCFWCMEPPFDQTEGVIETTPGYTGGKKENAEYKKVSSGTTEHYESIQILYDKSKVSYQDLLDVFWKNIDPTDDGGQFADRGPHYRTAVFVANDEERKLAEESAIALGQSKEYQGKKIVTSILPAKEFYPAEAYHHDYYEKNPFHYERYKEGSGRAPFLRKVWGKEK